MLTLFSISLFRLVTAAGILQLTLKCVDGHDPDDIGEPETEAKKNFLEYQRYVKLFDHQRAIQIDAVKSLQKSRLKYEQKYKLIETMLRDLFHVLEQAKNNLTLGGFVPGDPFPDKQPLRDAISKVFENTAMFGDLILRMPDLTHEIYGKNKQWEFLIGWGVWFSMESGIFQGPHAQLLSLMSMEIGLQPKDENYVNPYKETVVYEAEETEEDREARKKKEQSEKIRKKSEETRKKRRGPKLGGGGHTEL